MTVDRNLLFTNFAKAIISKDKEKDTVDSVNATVHMVGEDIFVEIDGAEGTRTPANTLIEVTDEQRVQAEIKNHVVTIVGSSENVAVGNSSYQRLKSVVADEAYIDELIANNLTIGGVVKASNATVEELDADYAKFKNVVIDQGQFDELVGTDLTLTGMLFGKDADFKKIVTNNAFVKGTLSASGLVAADGTIINLENTYADIKFAHIGEEAVNNLYAKKGTIGAASIDADGIHIAGDVVGINIHGDVIEGNTIKAESLIIKGSDGLYHQLNVDGGIKIEELTEEQQDEYNSKLHGSNIIANTITADQIYVDDLSALDATIGGFHISQGSVEENKPGAIYSGVKQGIENTTNGVYMDDEGQFYLGNNSSYLKFYKYTKEDGTEDYKLDISASSLKMSTGTLDLGQIEQAIDDASKVATNYLQFDSDGLVIGDLTDPDNPSNVLIDSQGVKIRNNETNLASFMENSIRLGENSDYHLNISLDGFNMQKPNVKVPTIPSKLNFDFYDKFNTGGTYQTRLKSNIPLILEANNALQEAHYVPPGRIEVSTDGYVGGVIALYGHEDITLNQNPSDSSIGSSYINLNEGYIKLYSNYPTIQTEETDWDEVYTQASLDLSDGKIDIAAIKWRNYNNNTPSPKSATLTTDSAGNLFVNDQLNAQLVNQNDYWGINLQSNNTYLRTPPNGLLPYQPGTNESYIGTPGWPFRRSYVIMPYWNKLLQQVQCIRVNFGNLGAGATTSYVWTFPQGFTNAPRVVVSKVGSYSNAVDEVLGCWTNNTYSTQVTVYVCNRGSATHSIIVDLIAVGATQ